MKKKGFTYIELMIAITIFTIIILTIMKLNSISQSNINKQISSQKMMFVAQKQMEVFKTSLSNTPKEANVSNESKYFQLDDGGDYYIVVNGDNSGTNNANVYLVTVWVRESPTNSSTELKLQSHVIKK